MFHHLTLAVRDRMIKELQEYWQDHPDTRLSSKHTGEICVRGASSVRDGSQNRWGK